MDLKELLGDLYTDAIAAKVGDKKLIVDDGKLIPAYRLKEETDKAAGLKTQLEAAESALSTLKESSKTGDALKAQIEQLSAALDTEKANAAKSIAQVKKQSALTQALADAGVKSERARAVLAKEFDIDAIELDERGGIKNADALLRPVKDDPALAPLFGTTVTTGTGHDPGPGLGTTDPNNPFVTKNVTEQVRLKKSNPALYEQYKAAAGR